MNMGWVKLHRQFIEWEWYSDHNTLIVFLHCLLKANHRDKKWRGEKIKRGEFLTGLEKFSIEVNLSLQKVRTAFSKLESTGEITRKTTSKGTRVIVCNYLTYQEREKENNKRITNEQQTSNKRVTTTKNDKNENNDKKEGASLIPSLSEVQDYFKKNGYSLEAAKKAYDLYQTSIEGTKKRMWRDSRDNPIRNWKMKMQSVWFKDENKTSKEEYRYEYD
jgi:hypothetical protein